MSNIILGFKDEKAQTKPIFGMGPESSRQELMGVWTDAKQKHIFPKGVICLKLYDLVENETAIFCGDHVAEELDAYATAESNRIKAVAKKKADAQKRVTDLLTAKKKVSKTAVERNAANSQVNTAKQLLEDAQANATANPEAKLFQDRLKSASEKSDKAKAAFTEADEAWLAAKSVLVELEKPTPTKE